MAGINPQKMFKDIAATCARFRAVPAKVAAETAARLSASMIRVAALRGHRTHGDASPVPNGVLIHAHTRTPGVGPQWMATLARVAKKAMTDAANGKG